MIGGFCVDIKGSYEVVGPYEERRLEPRLPPGVYNVWLSWGRPHFSPVTSSYDKVTNFNEDIASLVLADVRKFLDPKTAEVMKKFGQVPRRGFLLEGPPGSGKTTLLRQITTEIIEKYQGIVLYSTETEGLIEGIQAIRRFSPDITIVCVFEDFEGISDNPDFLALLDGADTPENVIFLATTNHIERIPIRVKNRPSRFARVLRVGEMKAEHRKAFLLNYIPVEFLPKVEIDDIVAKTDGLMIDHLKHICQAVFAFDLTLDQAVASMKELGPDFLEEDIDEEC
jgi:energy-coupling factor transporter ATP-binding protein EcfA2